MRLKRVKLFGFKTFADKTEFEVDGDLIAVVGPNGCGKSNLVDAILWGLGEGSSKNLRAGTGQDVIFSGSSRRKPLGFAEVSLLFDNEDGALPIDTTEVQISRRLNRAGDSEYAINRRQCRLRDVLDLLADSGLGRAGYAIVGQKEIDQALAASPEDRRMWVDEAAGVQRYRSRKVEALRRLISAKDHLSRVGDILHEIEVQREPLREQAEVAKRYRQALGALREVETGLLVVEIAKAVRELADLRAQVEESARLAASEIAKAEDLDQQAALVESDISELDRKIELERGTLQAAITAFERAISSIQLLEQKLASLDSLEQSIGTESEGAQMLIIEAEAELAESTAEAEIEAAELDRVRVACAGASEEARSLSAKLADAERQLVAAREAQRLRVKQETEMEHRRARLEAIAREEAQAAATVPQIKAAISEADAALEEHLALMREAETALHSARDSLDALEQEEAAKSRKARELLAGRALLEGRIRGIQATIEAHEGLNQGARAVLEAVDQGLLEPFYTPVGQAIAVEKKYATAIETALGGASNDLIVPTEVEAESAIALLKEHRLGRATFQPLTLMRTSDSSEGFRRLSQSPGVVGAASDLVQCKAEHREVIRSLLGSVLIVNDLEASISLAKTTGWERLVTLDGEVVHKSGAVTGGRTAGQHYGLVQRSAALAELELELSTISAEIERAESDLARIAAARERAVEDSVRAMALCKAREPELREAREWRAGIAGELASTERALAKLRSEQESIKGAPEALIQAPDVAGLESIRDEALRQLAARSADVERADGSIRDAEARLNAARAREQQAKRRLGQARESERNRVERLINIEPERRRASDEIGASNDARLRAERARKEAEKEIERLRGARDEATAKLGKLRSEAKDARTNAHSCSERAHQREIARTRADSRRAAALQRLIEEYGLTEDDALAMEPAVSVPPDAAALVSRLRRELKAMGEVNLGAIEAFERLSERHSELTAQREDILAGIDQVEASIKELDCLTRDRFLGTFEKLRTEFALTFEKLFAGGEGTISLTRPDDILETGIEIDVTLPGKKRQRLELLSGGERSLCATAFLFALLRVKPSPLVVLDEVDAPLDGRNVERYIELLREFRGQTQFILITHNPTTIEAAPVWLGVTMQEPGVSVLAPTRVAELHTERTLERSQNLSVRAAVIQRA